MYVYIRVYLYYTRVVGSFLYCSSDQPKANQSHNHVHPLSNGMTTWSPPPVGQLRVPSPSCRRRSADNIILRRFRCLSRESVTTFTIADCDIIIIRVVCPDEQNGLTID